MQMSSDIGSTHNPIMPIDTLAIAKALEAAGTPQKQAEAHARIWGEVVTHNIASKTDIESLRLSIEGLRISTKADIESLRISTKADIDATKADIESLRLSTKADIEHASLANKADIENLRKETIMMSENLRKDMMIELEKIRGEILKSKNSLLLWLIPLILGQGVAIVSILKITHL